MCRSRDPGSPSSVIGVRPAVISTGTFAREALMMAVAAFPVPTLTWTIAAAGRPPAAASALRSRRARRASRRAAAVPQARPPEASGEMVEGGAAMPEATVIRLSETKTVPFGPDSFYQLLVGDEAGNTPVRVGIQT